MCRVQSWVTVWVGTKAVCCVNAAQLVRATRASTTFPMCSLRLRSATEREISISDICNKNTGGGKTEFSHGGMVCATFTSSGLNSHEIFGLK